MKSSSQKVRRAHILLKADADGPNWTDAKIVEAFSCSTRAVEMIRERFVTEGFESVLNGKKRDAPPKKKLLDGEQEMIGKRVLTGSLPLTMPPYTFQYWQKKLEKRHFSKRH